MKRRRVRKRAEEIGREERKESPFALPSTALSYKFLSCALSVKRKQERREGEVREERQQGGDFNFLERY